MKKVLLVTVLSLCVSSAFAAETAVLKVKGTLTNSACTPELSNGGVVDYGNIRLGDLSPTANNQLGIKDVSLTIQCAAPTKVSWNLIDDRADSVANIPVENGSFAGGTIISGNQMYGVGKAGDVNIGNYSLFMKVDSVTADGKAADTISTQFYADGATWAKNLLGQTQGDNVRDITVAKSGTLEPVAFQTAVFPMATSLAIRDTTTLAITDDTPLDGQLTISLRYL